MITPSFRCRQDRGFVIVEIYLPSIHCKISNAEFDITPFQFTFHCSPYYLRLQFQSKAEIGSASAATSLISPTAAAGKPQGLCEGKGERATYDLATSTMTVYLPKAVDGEIFLFLDMPNLLLATHQQRKAMLKPTIEVLQSTSQDDDGVMLPASEAEEKRLKEAKGGSKTSPEDDDAAEEWEDEEEEAEDDEVEVEDELETEFVQMQISGQECLSFKRAGGEGASDDVEDMETKMAVKIAGTDASLLALENKLGTKKEAVVDANGWFRGGAADQSPEEATSSPDNVGVLLAGGSTTASKSGVLLADRGYGFNKEFTNVFAVMSKTDAQQNTNYVGEVVDVKNPDEKSRLDRRQERLMRETEDYDDEAFWGCVNEDLRDPNSELGELFAILMAPKGHGVGAAKRFVPWYVDAFESQLASSGMAFVSATSPMLANRPTTAEVVAAASLYTPSAIPRLAVEEDGEDYGTANIQSSTKGVIVAWEGNAGTVIDNPSAQRGVGAGVGAAGERKGPLVSEIFTENERLLAATAADAAAAGAEDSAAGVVLASRPVVATSTLSTRVTHHQNSAVGLVGSSTAAAASVGTEQRPLRLAIPTVPPSIAFTKEEAQLLLHIQPRTSPITPIPSNANEVCALLVDLLSAFVFDYLTTLGDGSVESVWTVTRLSPSLSYLDEPRNVYEALVGFARRAFIYPYLRHWALVHRVTRDVGIILLSGPQAVIKALLGLKHVLDNTEHHHMLTKLYVNPMIGYLSGCLRDETDATAIAATLQRTALEIHRCMTFEPSEEVASGTVAPPHIIDMLCDGMEGYADVVEDSAVKAAADAAALSAAEDDTSTSNSGGRGRGLVLEMLKSSAEKQKSSQADGQRNKDIIGSDICRKYGAIQYEPLAPFTLGLPIDMEEDGDE